MEKPTVLLIHGLIGSLDYFEPEKRIAGAAVHTCDLLGYGSQHGTDPESLTLAMQADYVAGLLDRLTQPRVWLLGHSMGGAIAMLAADRRADRIAGIISVEGNFTLRDAFWSKNVAGKSAEQWADDYQRSVSDIPAWLVRCRIEPTAERVARAHQILAHQPPETVRAMSRAIVTETGCCEYLDVVRRVIDRGVEIHLVAGELSAGDWGIPEFVRAAARSYHEQPGVGHLMMLEQPDGFCQIIEAILAR
jgi:pimeloyl-ACP methyl ester carboxylesterase